MRAYDADGNLTNDSRWVYVWDAENRLIQMIGTNVADAGKEKLEFDYDYGGRRIAKRVYDWNGGAWQLVRNHRFSYDVWNLVAELNATNNAVVRSYVWGTDLSGTMQGAGGVGGLLAINDTANGVHFPAYDGNGNVTGLTKATDGSTSATYEYGPFGEVIRATGPLANVNPFRFSTKYADDETDLLYYGYRYYGASSGRWLSRDPIEERGGNNLYAFVGNDGSNRADELGLRDRVPFPKNCNLIDDLKNLGEALDSLRRDYKNWRKGGFGDSYRVARKDSCNSLRNFLDLLEKCCGVWTPQQEKYFRLVRNVANTWCSDPPTSSRDLEREVKETIREFGVESEFELPDWIKPIDAWTINPKGALIGGGIALGVGAAIAAPPVAPVVVPVLVP